ncbi:MAG: hypothetical protein ACFFD4_18125 [Candidatus Odinarchaeota archaeon]
MTDLTLTVIQTLTAFFSFLTCLILSYLVLRKDYKFLLNRLFAAAILMMGMSTLFLVLSNIPVLLWQGDGPFFLLQGSYQSVVIALYLFNLAALYLMYGQEGLYSLKTRIYLIAGNALCSYVIWLTNPFSRVALGDVVSTTLFKVTVFGFLIISYSFTLVLFLLVYKGVEEEVKRKMQIFISGWLIGGLAMASLGLGDFFRILDMVGQVLLSIGVIVIYVSFSPQLARRVKETE